MTDTFEDITTEWEEVENLAEGTDYVIQNCGPNMIQSYVGTSAPSADTKAGTRIPVLMQGHCNLDTGESLYVRGLGGNSAYNINLPPAGE